MRSIKYLFIMLALMCLVNVAYAEAKVSPVDISAERTQPSLEGFGMLQGLWPKAGKIRINNKTYFIPEELLMSTDWRRFKTGTNVHYEEVGRDGKDFLTAIQPAH
jgi:hypothetical protein